jgi:transposase
MRRLESLRMKGNSGNRVLQIHLEELRDLHGLIVSLNRDLLLLSREPAYRESVRRLKTVPGVSTLTAMIFLTELGDIARFAGLDRLASYVGLIPDIRASGESERVGGLTFRRNPHLRAVLIEAAWVAARKDPVLLLAFNSYSRRMKKTVAIVKIARKLLNRMRYVLKNQMDYVPGVIQ